MIDLVFGSAKSASTDLVFGAGDTPAPVSATLTGYFAPLTVAISVNTITQVDITGAFAPMTFSGFVTPVADAAITGAFAPITVSMSAQYASNTARPTVGQSATAWQEAALLQTASETQQQKASAFPAGNETAWVPATPQAQQIIHPLPKVLSKDRQQFGVVFEGGTRIGTSGLFRHDDATRVHQDRATPFQRGAPIRGSTLFRHQDADRTKRISRASAWMGATHMRITRGSAMASATPFPRAFETMFQDGRRPPAGITTITPPTPPTPKPFDADLIFSWPWDASTHLVFGRGIYTREPITIPKRKVYIVLNSVHLRRVSDNAEVPAFPSLSMSIDVGSWAWGFQASIPESARSLVQSVTGEPVELKTIINGAEYRMIVDRIARNRRFGDSRLTITGRGKNSILDAPYSPVMAFANTQERTAQQLMNDALTVNGVSIGWGVDWGLTDWLVPAGAWSHQGTYISALQAIAGAAGGYLAPHATADTIRVLPMYPTPIWEWGGITPDFVLPADVVTQESTEWITKPDYNRVYVSGQGQGITGQVTRQGTAGDILAPMVVDQLITHADAARQRGVQILSDTGRQLSIRLRLPVLAETGIIEPGAFVQYSDGTTTHRGLVRATSVDVNMPEVWQTLSVETHATT